MDVHGHLRRRGPVLHLHRQHGGGDIRPALGGGGDQIVFPFRLGSVPSGAGGSGIRPGHCGPVGTGERAGHRPQYHQGSDGGQPVHYPAGGAVQILYQPAGDVHGGFGPGVCRGTESEYWGRQYVGATGVLRNCQPGDPVGVQPAGHDRHGVLRGEALFCEYQTGRHPADFWAPEVYERDGKFYMFFSADWRKNPTNEEENFRIGVAVSDKPTGPFKELADAPLFDPGYPVIDGNLIEDEDGRTYLYYSRCCYKHPVESEIADEAKKKGMFDSVEESWIYGVEVAPDLTHVIGEPVLLLRPPVKLDDAQSEWESRSVTKGEVGRRWTEGSFMLRHNGLYYMMYSANYFGGANYAVGYAVSEHPLGPFEKASNNPVLEKNVEKGGIVTGTGHNSVTWSKDGKQMYCVYHGRTQKTGDERVVFIDKMRINENGLLVVEGPTTDPQSIQ